MQITTNALLITAMALLSGKTLLSGAQTFITANVPPPIEGSAVGPDYVEAGHKYFIDWQIIKRTGCPGRSSRVWNGQDGFHITEADRPTALPTSIDVRTHRIPTVIPDLAPIGELSLSILGYFKCPNAEKVNFELGPVKMNVVRNK